MGRYVFSAYFGHDAGMALVGEGRILHFENERFTRKKHDQVSHEQVKDMLHLAMAQLGIEFDEIVAIAGMGCADDFGGARGRLSWSDSLACVDATESAYLDKKVLPCFYLPHHFAHASYAFYTSPYEAAEVMGIDGGGDAFDVREIRPYAPHGLAVIDTAVGAAQHQFGSTDSRWCFEYQPNTGVGGTWDNASRKFCNDDNYAAGTVMAMAGIPAEQAARYGIDPAWLDEARRLQDWTTAEFHRLIPETRSGNICLAGGVALNGIAAYSLLRRDDVNAVWVPPAVHDGGLTVGAALFVLHNVLKEPRRHYSVEDVAFAGYTDDALEAEPPAEFIAEQIAAGKVVAVAHGKAESGPRALGHRSFLADPRRPDMKDRLNRLKGRQSFRPVAPVVLRQDAERYFELKNPDCYAFMTMIAAATEQAKAEIPAAVHLDGSARVQVVESRPWSSKPSDDQILAQIVEAFRQLTGCPVVLNTSFNLGGEAMANTAEHALDTFQRSEADVLVVGDTIRVKA